MIIVQTESAPFQRRIKKCVRNTCSVRTLKKRVPIIEWLPKYNMSYLVQDLTAGIAVGLTAIPQGIAYAVVAGLSPEYGLYASLTSGFVYVVFGSCFNVTVGPTAILSTMVAKYVTNFSPEFAILAAFLSGVMQLVMGILHLGFLVDFISQPVISGFTTAAALQIAAAQFKSFFGLAGSSGNFFAESLVNFVNNIKTAKLWDSLLSCLTVIMLILLQKLGQDCKRTDGFIRQARWFIALARNAVVVVIGMIIAYVVKVVLDDEPLELIGEIGSGLPPIRPPPFSATVGNETYSFIDMLQALGPQSIILPLVSILESVAIAKAFSSGLPIDATQELIALGLCNILGSFAASMPITGSFTRTAINHASGVQTQAGGITKCLLLIFALSVISSTFYYIPKASLAGLIMLAMFSMIDYPIFKTLWKSSKREFLLMLVTLILCLYFGLEYGIITGIVIEAVMLMFFASRPKLKVQLDKTDRGDIVLIPLSDIVMYCAAERVRRAVLKASRQATIHVPIVLDATNLRNLDFTVATNLISVVKELEGKSIIVVFLNFNSDLKKMFTVIDTKSENKFVSSLSLLDLCRHI